MNKSKKNRAVLLVAALPVEARPLTTALGLKFHSHGEYRNDEFTLIITGVGRIASAVSTTKAFSLNSDYESALNFGLCGSGVVSFFFFLLSCSRFWRAVKLPISVGNFPLIFSVLILNLVRRPKRPMLVGIIPLTFEPVKVREVRYPTFANCHLL